jgi:6-phosphogluconolactonase (cycloisomerase 2 family)
MRSTVGENATVGDRPASFRLRAAPAALALPLVVLALTALPAGSQAAATAYVANHINSLTVPYTVSEYAIGTGGLLSPLSPPTVVEGGGPFDVAISPNGKSVYVTNTTDDTVSQYNVDPITGVLSPKNPSTVVSGQGPEAIAVTPDGRSAYVTNAGPSNDIWQYSIDPATGTLSPKNPARIVPGVTPADVAVTPDGRTAYVSTFFDGILQYNIDRATGALSPKTPSSVPTAGGSGFETVVVTPNGRSAYVTGGTTISQYSINPVTGALSSMTPATVPGGPDAAGIAVTPDGRNAYAANLGNGAAPDTVSQYSIDRSTGALSPKTPPTVSADVGPTGVAVAPNGRSLYVTNQQSDDISQYSIGRRTGALSPKTPATVAAGLDPIGIAVRPPVPTRKRQCKHGGWMNFPQFKKQAECVAFVHHNR